MSTTLEELLTRFVYVQLQDTDNNIRWTREELTQYVNFALRDLVARRPEAGAVTDRAMLLREGFRQQLPLGTIRLKEVVRNIDAIYGEVDLTGVIDDLVDVAGVVGIRGAVDVAQTFSQLVDIVADATAQAYAEIELRQLRPSIDVVGGLIAGILRTPTYVAYTKEDNGGGAYTARIALYDDTHTLKKTLYSDTALTSAGANVSDALKLPQALFVNNDVDVAFAACSADGSNSTVRAFDLIADVPQGVGGALASLHNGMWAKSPDGRYIYAMTTVEPATPSNRVMIKINAATLSVEAQSPVLSKQYGTEASTPSNNELVNWRAAPRPARSARPVLTLDGGTIFAAGGMGGRYYAAQGLVYYYARLCDIVECAAGIQRIRSSDMSIIDGSVVESDGFQVVAVELAKIPNENTVLAFGFEYNVVNIQTGDSAAFLATLNTHGKAAAITKFDIVGDNLVQQATWATFTSSEVIGVEEVPPTLFPSPTDATVCIVRTTLTPYLKKLDTSTMTFATDLAGANIPSAAIADCFFSGDGTQFLAKTAAGTSYNVYDVATWAKVGTVTPPTGTIWLVPYNIDTFTLD